MLSLYGRDVGLRVARKHLGWTLDRIPGTAALRARLMRIEEPEGVLDALATWRQPETMARAA
jgi:tRNA-dihydrouridine synthase